MTIKLEDVSMVDDMVDDGIGHDFISKNGTPILKITVGGKDGRFVFISSRGCK